MIFWFNGESFRDKVESIAGSETAYSIGKKGFLPAEYDFETKSIPGKNGDVTISNNRYKNVNGTYQCVIRRNYGKCKVALLSWLSATAGRYCKLEDTDEPGYFRFAKYKGYEEQKVAFDDTARIDLKFECMPQRFLQSGEEPIVLGDQPIYNPTGFNSLPLIKIEGENIRGGEITISNGGHETTFGYASTTPVPVLTIDSESGEVFVGAELDSESSVTGDFPVLYGGDEDQRFNYFFLSGPVKAAKITVIPRWWTL